MSETDGIEEAIDGQLRIAITAAGQIGEYIARARESALQRAQANGDQEARELAARLHAERLTAHAQLAAVRHDGWWDAATGAQIARAWQVARAWAGEEPDARNAVERIRTEVRSRYGIDVDDARANPAGVQAALDQALADRQRADAERGRAAIDEAEAALLMQQADAQEREARDAGLDTEPGTTTDARAEAAFLYDSAERRQHLARDLEAKGIAHEVVETHLRSDISQATPPAAAVASTRSSRTRRATGRGPAVVRKPELSR